ncbi:zinc ribbon domain-containing protein, partial [bacterium]|nr:zinc ribbon domain-containing protein [bacterium]MBU1614206.1 zinc ribbon domain-containing protein [bacterium]
MNDFEALGGVSTLLVILVIAIVIFLILREVVTWYWKINQRVGLLEDILAELRALRTGQPISKRLHCDQCGAETVEGDEFCPGCGSKVARSKNE